MEKSTAAWQRHIQDVKGELSDRLERGEINEETIREIVSSLASELSSDMEKQAKNETLGHVQAKR